MTLTIPDDVLMRHVLMQHGGAGVEATCQRLLGKLHTRQRALVEDPAKIKAGLTGRRAGKSHGNATALHVSALRNPGDAFSLYLGLTRKIAKMQLWPLIKRLNVIEKLGGVPNESELTLSMPNGHTIFLGGADNQSEIEKYRGYPYAMVIPDEAGAMGPWLRPLIEDVAEMGTMDRNGTIMTTGTPGPVCDGIFWDMTGDPDRDPKICSTHTWTCLDNPHVPMAAAWLSERKRIRGWTDDHPTYRREFLGHWVPDSSALVYQYDHSKNGWDGHSSMGEGPWVGVLGIDLGYDDGTAFVVIRYSHACRTAYVTHAEKHLDWPVSRSFDHARKLQEEHNVVQIVVDGSKEVRAEWSQRFRVPLTAPLKKNDKRDHIELVNDDLRLGHLKIRDGLPLIHELRTVVWDERRKKPSDRVPNDLADAMEYAWVACGHYAQRKQEVTIAPSYQQRIEEEAERIERDAIRTLDRQQRQHRRWDTLGL